MSLPFITALVLSIVCLVAPAWADFEAGMDAYNRGDYATALREWRPLAEQGQAEAQHNLGELYAEGQGVPQDYGKARQWVEKAAAQGNVDAAVQSWLVVCRGQGSATGLCPGPHVVQPGGSERR